MICRLAAVALLLLVLPLPAEAGRGAIVLDDDASVQTDATTREMLRNCVLGAFRTHDADFDVIPPGAANVASMMAATYTVAGVTTSYDWQVIIGFNKSQTTNHRVITFNQAQVYRPDSLLKSGTTASRWPAKSTLFVASNVSGANFIATGSGCTGCSTGVAGPTAGYSATRAYTHASYVAGGVEEWRNTVGIQGFPMHAAPAGGINRKLIVNQTAATVTTALTNTCSDCDAPFFGGRPASSDSVVLWERLRGEGDAAPLIFCSLGIGSSYAVDWGVLGAAIARLDYHTGGEVIRSPFEMGILVQGGFSRGPYDTSDLTAGGIWCPDPADSCDLVYASHGVDSTRALADRTGIVKLTVAVQPESVSSYPDEKAMWEKLGPYVRYSPRSNLGCTSGVGAQNSSASLPHDVWGYTRARRVLPPGATGLPDPCDAAGDSASIYCGLKWQFDLMERHFAGKVSHVVYAPMRGDWSPTTMTRASPGPGVDSVLWAARRAGVVGLVANLDYFATNVNASGYLSAAGPSGSWTFDASAATNPAGYGFTRNTTYYGTVGSERFRVKMLASRGPEVLTHPRFYMAGHDLPVESGIGAYTGMWYWRPFMAYTHWFPSKTPVLIVSAAHMGKAGNPAYSGQNAWWAIKWTVNRMAAMNRMAGREVARTVWLDDLTP